MYHFSYVLLAAESSDSELTCFGSGFVKEMCAVSNVSSFSSLVMFYLGRDDFSMGGNPLSNFSTNSKW